MNDIIINDQGHAMHASDQALYVNFYKKWVRNNYETQLQGRPIDEQKDYVVVREGGAKSWYDGPVTDEFKFRFREQWRHFSENGSTGIQGTPLSNMTQLSPGDIEAYQTNKIYTVEQLAAISDSVLANLFHGAELHREAAKSYVKRAKDSAAFDKVQKEADDLKEQLKVLMERVQILETPPDTKSKRKPQVENPLDSTVIMP